MVELQNFLNAPRTSKMIDWLIVGMTASYMICDLLVLDY